MAASADAGGRERPAFDSLMEIHRREARFHRLLAGLLVVAGLGLVLAGVGVGGSASYPLAALGVFVACLAVIPWREALERRDRIQGLEVLRDEWDELAGGPAGGEARDRLHALLTGLYRFPA